jgi:ABC-type dipeptide/oligopeptide/nickel transport system permease subunit
LRNVILVLGISTWVNYARVVRGERLAQRHGEIVGWRVLGATRLRIVLQARTATGVPPASPFCRHCWSPA